MEFVIDKVSEDSFYENLLIGLPKILEKLPNVNDIILERYPPVQHNVICAWEQKNGVLLPEDLRNFYASTNGLYFAYNFCYKDSGSDEDKICGQIDVNNLNDLAQIYGYEIKSDPGVNTNGERYELRLGSDSKVFELVNLRDIGRVALIYINHRYLPTIWMSNATMKFYFLADDFTTYLRMAIHHLGIPFWQFSFTSDGVPEWSEMIFRLLAPAVLTNHKKVEEFRKSEEKRCENDSYDVQINKIDPNIFKSNKTPAPIQLVNENIATSPCQPKKKQWTTKQKTQQATKTTKRSLTKK